MLTRKEKEIYNLIVEGKTNKEIAQELYNTEKTIKNQVAQILGKHKCKNRTELVVKHYKGELK